MIGSIPIHSRGGFFDRLLGRARGGAYTNSVDDAVVNDPPIPCVLCGYDLQGHKGATRRCPECGHENRLPIHRGSPPLKRPWLYLIIVPTLVGFTAIAGFHLLLVAKGLRLNDLWNAGRPLSGPPKPDAATLAGFGATLARGGFLLAAITVVYRQRPIDRQRMFR